MKKKNSVLLNWLSFNSVQKKIDWILKYWKYEFCNYQNKTSIHSPQTVSDFPVPIKPNTDQFCWWRDEANHLKAKQQAKAVMC